MTHLLIVIIYLSFISLGLPDALLGSAWPSMYPELQAPVSGAGAIFMIIAAGTVVSALMGDRLIRRFGSGKLTFLSVATTAIAILGFSISRSFTHLCLWAIPYGLGAGAVDACLNNYVALHYSSSHMSWLHCMWGIGATTGPYIMGHVLTGGGSWNSGYRIIFFIQLALAVVLMLSLPLWKGGKTEAENKSSAPLSFRQIISIPGVKQIMLCFFCYCALEQTSGLWASSYLALYKGVDSETAAFFGSIFFLGITVGRAFNGFLAVKFSDAQLIRMGQCIIAVGIVAMLLPLGELVSLVGLILIGLGCAPIYPCIIHSTPLNFGSERSQSIVGVEMASAYVGNIVMPPFFGIVAEHISISLLPFYLAAILLLMYCMYSSMLTKCGKVETHG